MKKFDLGIVGAGIVGLATARRLLELKPRLQICIVEKEPEIAQHQTGHNSGVIHSGIYYKPGSLKAELCTKGRDMMYRFLEEKGIPNERCGKFIVAVEEAEIPRLENLYERGQANGIADLRILSGEELREREPHVRGIRAIEVPCTGIVDFTRVAATYREEIESQGVDLRFGFRVDSIEDLGLEIRVQSSDGEELLTNRLITCGGLYSDKLAKMTGAKDNPRIVPFRGDYYILKPEKRDLIRGNIYPVPDPAFPFLGVHFTPRMNGDVWLGPNAVLAFAREGYRFGKINLPELWESLTWPGFLRLATKHFTTGMGEMLRDIHKPLFVKQLQRYVPELQPGDCIPGPAGVRAQALDMDGSLVDDFIFEEGEKVLHVRNAPSPAATSSLAIAERIADRALRLFEL